jgi:DNA-binding MarR family transcriptional regulator
MAVLLYMLIIIEYNERNRRMEMKANAKELFDTLRQFRKMSCLDAMFQDLNFSEVTVLGIIRHEEVTDETKAMIQVKNLSEKMKISRPALNTILNRLEEKNLIERVRTKEDRKAVFIRMTEQAYHKLNEKYDRITVVMNSIVEKMGDGDTDMMIMLLKKLYNILENEGKRKC